VEQKVGTEYGIVQIAEIRDVVNQDVKALWVRGYLPQAIIIR